MFERILLKIVYKPRELRYNVPKGRPYKTGAHMAENRE